METGLVDPLLGLFFRGFIPAVLLPAERDLVLSNLSGYISTYISGGKLSDASDKPVIRDFVRSLMSAMKLNTIVRVAIGVSIHRDFRSPTPVLTSPFSSPCCEPSG